MSTPPAALQWSTDNCTVGRTMEVLGERSYLTEDAPGSLCLEHGYDVPRRHERDAARG